MRLRLTIPLLVPALLAGCQEHGKYTSAAQEEALSNAANLRAGTDYDLADQQFHSGDLDRALKTVEGSIAQNDQVAKSHLLHGRILIEMGRLQDALGALTIGIELDPEEPEFYYVRGMVFEQLGFPERALEEYVIATDLDGSLPQYRLALAETLMELERLEEARDLLEAEVGIFVVHPGFRQALGHISLMEGDLEGALRSFSDAVLLSPGDPILLEDLCRVQIAAGQYVQAEATLDRLLREEGYDERSDLERLHAACLLELHRPVEARAILIGLTRSPTRAIHVEAWTGLVDVSLMLGDDRLLRSAADRLLALAPDHHEGYLALATWQRRTGDLDGALVSTREAIVRAGDDPTPRELETLIQRQLSAN